MGGTRFAAKSRFVTPTSSHFLQSSDRIKNQNFPSHDRSRFVRFAGMINRCKFGPTSQLMGAVSPSALCRISFCGHFFWPSKSRRPSSSKALCNFFPLSCGNCTLQLYTAIGKFTVVRPHPHIQVTNLGIIYRCHIERRLRKFSAGKLKEKKKKKNWACRGRGAPWRLSPLLFPTLNWQARTES